MGVLSLATALAEFPDKGICVMHRLSTPKQAGRGNSLLEEKAAAVADEVRSIVGPGRVKRVMWGVESSRLSRPRPFLRECGDYCDWRGLMMVTGDESRFGRPEDTSFNAMLTEADFDLIHEMTKGVPLATILPPGTTESERRSIATKRRGNAGRPSSIDDDLMWKVLAHIGVRRSNGRFEHSLRQVAAKCGCSHHSVARLLERIVPDGSGRRWKDVEHPLRIYSSMYSEVVAKRG